MPDKALAQFLHRGITEGFRVGFDRSSALRSAKGNLGSVDDYPGPVREYIEEELRQATIRSAMPGEVVHTSPIGLIPKGGQPGKFRLIVDLSSPHGASVNDGIDPELCSLSYSSVDEAVARVRRCGIGALMAKLDLKSAYRRVPVHPDDQSLLGMSWDGHTFCDKALPFGLRSAPKLFTAVADGLSWALQCEGVTNLLHYLDDFLFWSEANSPDCARALSTAVPLCHKLGLPVASQKVVGPTSSIVFLGILIDSVRQEVRLPDDKLARLRQELRTWGDKRAATKRQLQSLIGLLNHAAKVVRPGRPWFDRYDEDSEKAESEGTIEPPVPGGHSVVAGVPPRLEWSGLLPRRPPSGDTVLRRIGSLGLRGFRARVGRVASAPVARLLVGDSDSGEGAGTDHGRLGCVGEQLVGGHCAGVLRQHGRSTVSQQRLREGPTTQSSAPSTRVALREVGGLAPGRPYRGAAE